MTDTFRIGGIPHDTYWMAKLLADMPAGRPMPFDLPLGRTPYPPAVEVRLLRRGDGGALQQFERDLLDGPPLFLKAPSEVTPDISQIEAQIVELIETKLSHVLVATDGQQRIVAHGGVWREPWSRLTHDAFCQLNVLRPWWGCGIGRQLAGRLEDWAHAHNLARLSTGLQAHNLRGLRFATRRGFCREVLSPGYARCGDVAIDRVRMMRPVG
jgi:GNAT superfamily N-acetyltransferase